MIYLDLFIGFLKVGLFSFGGSYGAIPLIREVVLSYGWIDEEMMTTMIAVSESTPGPIMVNLATYVGSSQGGILGAFVATFAVSLPAFIIIIAITEIVKKFIKNKIIQAIISGVIPCVTGIIIATGCFMVVNNCFDLQGDFDVNVKAIILTLLLSVVYFGSRKILKKGISPIMLIVASALSGIVVYSF